MPYRSLVAAFLFVFSLLPISAFALVTCTIYSQTAVNIALIGYSGLTDSSLFKGNISAGETLEIETPYRGFALLRFEGGQVYPVIIGDKPFALKSNSPAEPSSFVGSNENAFLYKLLSGSDPGLTQQYPFAHLMIQAKRLLESSHSVHTIKELADKKNEFHEFVRVNYESLSHSDMVRRLIAQYFMMHEYVDYHIEGAPVIDINRQYQKMVLEGVRNWLEILKSHIPEHEILNYCLSLYYNRSMVTLASLIIENFRPVAYCPGDEKKISFDFPEELQLTGTDGHRKMVLGDFKGNKIISFVSDDCPVSMIETVSIARKLIRLKTDAVLIVAPLQKLSEKHLLMNKMVSGGNMVFITDEKWRKEHCSTTIKLPLFVKVRAD